jgi:adenosyl cobinamide kinase/adenosyl cobinamide phosphate guanylyltransferase
LRFYGFVDDVEVRWSRAGMTNQTVLVDTLTKAVQAGLISQKKAHDQYNYDDDEEQNAEDYKLVQEETASKQTSLFGGGDFE